MLRTMSLAAALVAGFSFVAAAQEKPAEKPAEKPKRSEAELKAMQALRQMGVHVMELAQNDSRLEVAFHLADGKVTDEKLAPLKDLKDVYQVNLRGTDITDAGLANLAPLTSLTRLHLEKTKITDAGLAQLKPLANLEYLNLYGTAVTDAGLAQLEGLKKLKKIYLWESKVTDEGCNKLKAAVPEVQIIRGIVEAKPAEEKKEEKK